MTSEEGFKDGVPGDNKDVDGLPDEWKRLEQVRHELEGWKEELRVNAHKRLEREVGDSLPPLTSGQVVEQKLFYIYVDRPVVKERITNKLQRTFYEREYVKMTKLVNEVQLPTEIQPLGRELVVLDEGDGKGERSTDVTNGNIPAARLAHSNGSSVTPPADEGKGAPRAVNEKQEADLVRGGALEGKKASKNPFKGFAQKEENPFTGFAQPAQPGAGQPSASLVKQKDARKKPKRKFGLRWCFAAPFTQDGSIPEPHKSQLKVEVLSQTSTQDLASSEGGTSGKLPDSGVASRQNGLEDKAGDSRQQSVGTSGEKNNGGDGKLVGGGGKEDGGGGDGRSPQEAVKAALVAGAADESQHETFTRVEEVAVTTETTERFVEHNYFQLEYVILVTYKGERLAAQSYEILSKERFLKQSSRPPAATEVA